MYTTYLPFFTFHVVRLPCLRTDIKKVLLQVDSNGYFPDDDDASTHLEKCRQEKRYFTYLRLM